MLMSSGMDEALFNAFEQKINEELKSLKYKWFVRIQNVYARRRPH